MTWHVLLLLAALRKPCWFQSLVLETFQTRAAAHCPLVHRHEHTGEHLLFPQWDGLGSSTAYPGQAVFPFYRGISSNPISTLATESFPPRVFFPPEANNPSQRVPQWGIWSPDPWWLLHHNEQNSSRERRPWEQRYYSISWGSKQQNLLQCKKHVKEWTLPGQECIWC